MSLLTSQKRLRKTLSHLHKTPITLNPQNTNTQNELLRIDMLDNKIALITLTNPPVNSLPHEMIKSLDEAYEKLNTNENVKAIIITGRKGFFSGGADIRGLQKLTTKKDDGPLATYAHELLNKIELSPKPYIAAVNGYALGGGCELAMGCIYRIMSHNAKIGLPEVSLGLIPGFGGTQRLPRLIGFENGINSIMYGTSFNSKKALKMGLVDEICDINELIPKCKQAAIGKISPISSMKRVDKLPSCDEGLRIISRIRKEKSKLILKSPSINNVLESCSKGILNNIKNGYKGINAELIEFNKCIKSVTAKSMIHLFFAQRLCGKLPKSLINRLERKKANKIRNVGILGGGTIGSSVCALLVANNIPVRLKEVSKLKCNEALQRIKSALSVMYDKGLVKSSNLSISERLGKFLVLQTNYASFDTLDLVIECVLEHLSLKRALFSDLFRLCRYNCIFATASASISPLDISSKLSYDGKKRVLGIHFFTPANLMSLVEIIDTPKLNKSLLLDIFKFLKSINKIPVTISSKNNIYKGVISNRLFFPYRLACNFLIEHGVDLYRIDNVLENLFGMIGINKMTDKVGIDVFYEGQLIYLKNFKGISYNSSLLKELCERRRYGVKSGAGFYKYDNDNIPKHDYNSLDEILETVRKDKVKFGYEIMDEEIIEMLLYPVVNECYRLLSEGAVTQTSDLDIMSVFGYDFPRKYGGIFFWANNIIGLQEVASKLQRWSLLYGTEDTTLNITGFFNPCDLLIQKAEI